MDRVPITREGYGRIREELDRLKRVDRVQIIRDIQIARAHGDIGENAEYHAAREKQGWIEAKIRDLETKLASSDILDVSTGPKVKVCFGARLRVEDLESGEEKVYRIVGPAEADIDQGLISITSPLARAMMNKEVGDEVVFQAPRGTKEYEVLEIFD
ncbi:MAG TPA: transcription elongation factor GreA [Deferrisomatales bacterium]|nr:transcription elongation factor GreA [Deferrisomatales bacterium]